MVVVSRLECFGVSLPRNGGCIVGAVWCLHYLHIRQCFLESRCCDGLGGIVPSLYIVAACVADTLHVEIVGWPKFHVPGKIGPVNRSPTVSIALSK